MGFRIWRSVAELANDLFYVLRLAAEKEPAGARTEVLGIFLHHGRGVVHRISGDRDQGNIRAEAISQEILHVRELLVDHRTVALAVREEKIDQDHLVLEDVGEESALLSILRYHRKVGEVASRILPQHRRRSSLLP